MPKKNYDPKQPSQSYDRADYEAFRNSSIASSLASAPGMRFDSAEDASVFFARELDYIKAQTYDRLYPNMTALQLFPTTSEADPGAESVTYYSYDKFGLAKIIQNYATDLPRADVTGKPTTVPIKSLGASYGYSVQEMRASRYAGKSLDVKKSDAAKYAIDYATNKIAWSGDTDSGLVGVLSPGNDIPVFTLPNGVSGSTKWVDKTPTEILEDINAMQAFTATLTKSVEQPDILALPTDAYLHLANTPMLIGGVATSTIMKWVLDNSPRISQIIEVPELNADSEMHPYTGQGVAFMYSNDDTKFAIEIPMPFLQHPVQPKGLEFEVPCEARIAGAVIYYPLSMLIVPGV